MGVLCAGVGHRMEERVMSEKALAASAPKDESLGAVLDVMGICVTVPGPCHFLHPVTLGFVACSPLLAEGHSLETATELSILSVPSPTA